MFVPTQFIGGEVASYRGARVISLKGVALSTVDVPLTKTVYRHIEARDFKQAHAVACLGVTQVSKSYQVRYYTGFELIVLHSDASHILHNEGIDQAKTGGMYNHLGCRAQTTARIARIMPASMSVKVT